MNPRLTNWRLTSDGVLKGQVSGHPRFHDGELITTSWLKWINFEGMEWTAQTQNTLYVLGHMVYD